MVASRAVITGPDIGAEGEGIDLLQAEDAAARQGHDEARGGG